MEEIPTVPFNDLQFEANFNIPFDLFVSKKHDGLGSKGFTGFTDSKGNLAYRVQNQSATKSTDHRSSCVKLIIDPSGNTLFSIHRGKKGSWKVFRGNENGEKDLTVKVDRTLDEFARTECCILLVDDQSNEGSKTELKMIGCPFKRACTIYKGDSILAESSLMYKLGIGSIFVPRNRFRVTIFPGFADHALVVSLIVIFFDGRKLWI